ncbi:serine protease [Bradyrhizobium zhanjiangense]|nr:serine protease [Bradyrhizobium zhanjiangense]
MVLLLLACGYLTSIAHSRELTLTDIIDRAASRVANIKVGGAEGTGYVFASSSTQVLIATARHVVESALDTSRLIPSVRWAFAPDGCSPDLRAKATYSVVRDGQSAIDVAVIVADADCSPDLGALPSAWVAGEPTPGSRFHAVRAMGNPPTKNDVGPFWFSDTCLKAGGCIDRKRFTLSIQGFTEKGMSGAPVVIQQGIVGLVLGGDDLAAWPALQIITALCAGKSQFQPHGFDISGLACQAAGSDVISNTLAEAEPTGPSTGAQGKCDPRIGKALRDSSELGEAYLCRLDNLARAWEAGSRRLNCLEWSACREPWLKIVAENGFPLGLSPPTEWADLLDLLGIYRNPADLVLSHPSRIADFRAAFAKQGFRDSSSADAVDASSTNLTHPSSTCVISRNWDAFVHPNGKPGDLLASTLSSSSDLVLASMDYGPMEASLSKYTVWKYVPPGLQFLGEKQDQEKNTFWHPVPGPTLNANYMFVTTVPLGEDSGYLSAVDLWKPGQPPIKIENGINPFASIRFQQGWLAYVPPLGDATAKLLFLGDGANVKKKIDLDSLANKYVGGPILSFNDRYLAIFGYDLARGIGDFVNVFERDGDQWKTAGEIKVPSGDIVLDLDIRDGKLAVLVKRSQQVIVEIREQSSQWKTSKSIKTDLTNKYALSGYKRYDRAKLLILGDLVVVGDPRWTDSDDWTEVYKGAIHVFSLTQQNTTDLTIVNEKRKGWDSFGNVLALVGNTLLSGKTHGAQNNVGQIISIDLKSLQDLMLGCSNR